MEYFKVNSCILKNFLDFLVDVQHQEIGPIDELVGCISFKSASQGMGHIKASFEEGSFVFDLAHYEALLNQEIYNEISEIPIVPTNTTFSLVKEYLYFSGYQKTFQALPQDSKLSLKGGTQGRLLKEAISSRRTASFQLESSNNPQNNQIIDSLKIILTCQKWLDFLISSKAETVANNRQNYFETNFLADIQLLYNRRDYSAAEKDYIEVRSNLYLF